MSSGCAVARVAAVAIEALVLAEAAAVVLSIKSDLFFRPFPLTSLMIRLRRVGASICCMILILNLLSSSDSVFWP